MANTNAVAQQVAQSVQAKPAMDQINQLDLLAQAQQVHPTVRKFIARRALGSQVLKKQKNYYSTVRFPFTITQLDPPNGTTFRYQLARKKVTAFSYGSGDDMTTAGFPADFRANDADTNLITRYDTGGATVQIFGISLHLSETSDAFLAKLIWSECFADISLDGSQRYVLLGRLGRISSPGGLYGVGQSRATVPGVGESVANIGALTNGLPHQNNFYRLTDKIQWNPSSKVDSRFQIRFEVVRDIQFDVQSRVQSPGITAYTPPTKDGEFGTFVDITAYLHTRENIPRSKQQ